MKETYNIPVMEVIEFESEDVITASGGTLYDENETILDMIG